MTTEYEFATSDLTQHLYRFAKKDAQFLTEDPKKKDEATTAAPKAPVTERAIAIPGAAPRPVPIAKPEMADPPPSEGPDRPSGEHA